MTDDFEADIQRQNHELVNSIQVSVFGRQIIRVGAFETINATRLSPSLFHSLSHAHSHAHTLSLSHSPWLSTFFVICMSF
jgi:hypothetical protein